MGLNKLRSLRCLPLLGTRLRVTFEPRQYGDTGVKLHRQKYTRRVIRSAFESLAANDLFPSQNAGLNTETGMNTGSPKMLDLVFSAHGITDLGSLALWKRDKSISVRVGICLMALVLNVVVLPNLPHQDV